MNRTESLVGKRFGKLLVMEQSVQPVNGRRQSICHCVCDCGREVDVAASHLQKSDGTIPNNPTRSCGCTHTVGDLTGRRFGRLTVLSRHGTDRQGIQWLCQCDCGGQKITSGSSLVLGITSSCGCALKEAHSKLSAYASVGNKAANKPEAISKRVKKIFGEPGSPQREKRGQDLANALEDAGVRYNGANIAGISDAEPLGSNKYRGVCWVASKKRWLAYCQVSGKRWQKFFSDEDDAKRARDEMQKEMIEEAGLDQNVETYKNKSTDKNGGNR